MTNIVSAVANTYVTAETPELRYVPSGQSNPGVYATAQANAHIPSFRILDLEATVALYYNGVKYTTNTENVSQEIIVSSSLRDTSQVGSGKRITIKNLSRARLKDSSTGFHEDAKVSTKDIIAIKGEWRIRRWKRKI